VAVVTDLTWRLAAHNDAPGGLLEFRPAALWQRQADTVAAENFVCDVGLDELSP